MDFCIGLFLSSLIFHVINTGYADITSMKENLIKEIENDIKIWINQYNKDQEEFYGKY